MRFPRISALPLLAFAVCALLPMTAQAEPASATALAHAKIIGGVCPGQWETQACLAALSQSNLVMVGNYGGALQEKKLNAAAETLKEHCAASTAATKGEYPAYAMKSAFIECANIITDLSTKTSTVPDLSQYQLLIAGISCLNKEEGCAILEKSLKGHAAP